jgi:hypothetical protein
LGNASDVFVSDERSRIQAALDSAPEPMSPKELMLATGIKNRNSIDLLLMKMVRDGQIDKAGRGKYASSGKIRKKDPAAEQPTEVPDELSVPADLSDLSPNEEPGVRQTNGQPHDPRDGETASKSAYRGAAHELVQAHPAVSSNTRTEPMPTIG